MSNESLEKTVQSILNEKTAYINLLAEQCKSTSITSGKAKNDAIISLTDSTVVASREIAETEGMQEEKDLKHAIAKLQEYTDELFPQPKKEPRQVFPVRTK